MATPFSKIKLLLQALGGSLDEPVIGDEEDREVQAEVEKLNRLSAQGISTLENAHGKQTMVVDKDKGEETDRLGHKKPKGGTTGKKLSQEPNIESRQTQGQSLEDR